MHKNTRIVGLVVFLVGLVMLVAVFSMALDMLRYSRTVQITDVAKQLPGEAFQLLGRVLALFALATVASSVAARGIQLFEASRPTAAEPETPVVPASPRERPSPEA